MADDGGWETRQGFSQRAAIIGLRRDIIIWSFPPWKFRWVNGPALVALGDLHVIKTLSSLRDRRLWENLYARKRSLGVGGHWISLYSCYIETNMLFQ